MKRHLFAIVFYSLLSTLVFSQGLSPKIHIPEKTKWYTLDDYLSEKFKKNTNILFGK